jgi:hypothetical protein
MIYEQKDKITLNIKAYVPDNGLILGYVEELPYIVCKAETLKELKEELLNSLQKKLEKQE